VSEDIIRDATIPLEGDGSAAFFSDGTDTEYQEHVRDSSGWRKFYNKVKSL
jgi:hypothetical protein